MRPITTRAEAMKAREAAMLADPERFAPPDEIPGEETRIEPFAEPIAPPSPAPAFALADLGDEPPPDAA